MPLRLSRQSLQAVLLVLALSGNLDGCSNGFSPVFDGNCFRRVPRTSNDEAEKGCVQLGAHLSSIHSKEENEKLREYVGRTVVWIGLHCTDGPNRTLAWTDRTPFDYHNFSKSVLEAACEGAGPSCFLLDGNTGLWMAFCNYRASGLCRHSKPNSRCSDYDSLPGTEHCIDIKRTPTVWEDAFKVCRAENGNLAPIENEEMNNNVHEKAKSLGIRRGVHIGVLHFFNETVAAADDNNSTYTNFATGFPNDALGGCTSMEIGGPLGGLWLSNSCSRSKLPFLCIRSAYDWKSTKAPSGCPSKNLFTANETEAVEIFSPSYPLFSGPVSCVYFLVAQSNGIRVVFDDFETNSCCDRVRLSTGTIGEEDPLTFVHFSASHSISDHSRLSGSQKAGASYATSTSNVVRLEYEAEDGMNVRGWRARFFALPSPPHAIPT